MSHVCLRQVGNIVWLRRDLRLADQLGLQLSLNAKYVIPVYVLDSNVLRPRVLQQVVGFPKLGPHRAKGLLQALQNFNTSLCRVGSRLIFCGGDTKEEIAKIINWLQPHVQKIELHFQMDIQEESYNLENSVVERCQCTCQKAGIEFEARPYWDLTLFHPDDLPYREFSRISNKPLQKTDQTQQGLQINQNIAKFDVFPDTMTKFRNATLGVCNVRETIPAPDKLPPLPPISEQDLLKFSVPTNVDQLYKLMGAEQFLRNLQEVTQWDRNLEVSQITAFPFELGEENALKRLREYLWGDEMGQGFIEGKCPLFLDYFKETRMQAVGVDNSTKLSPFLALGCISPRMVYEEVNKVNEALRNSGSDIQRENVNWLIMHLCIRDFFIFTALKADKKLMTEEGIQGQPVKWMHDEQLFTKWCRGQTGFPFLDACMKELVHTGYMSNRGRQNVASFLTKDLFIDWRWGAALFECLLIDHDLGVNYSNWNYFAGIGTDPKNRKFKTVSQGMKYDEQGELISRWIPGLARFGANERHQPWLIKQDGFDYWDPLVQIETQVGVGSG